MSPGDMLAAMKENLSEPAERATLLEGCGPTGQQECPDEVKRPAARPGLADFKRLSWGRAQISFWLFCNCVIRHCFSALL